MRAKNTLKGLGASTFLCSLDNYGREFVRADDRLLLSTYRESRSKVIGSLAKKKFENAPYKLRGFGKDVEACKLIRYHTATNRVQTDPGQFKRVLRRQRVRLPRGACCSPIRYP